MKYSTFLILIVATATHVAAPGLVRGEEEGVLARWNPFRIVRSRGPESRSTPMQPDISAANLQRRGIHSPLVDDSISRRSALQQQQQYRWRFGADREDSNETNVAPLRSRFAERAIDTATIDQRAVRADQAHENGGPLAQRTEAGNPPTMAELQAHLLSRGIDPAMLEQRIARMNAARENGRRSGQNGETAIEPDLNSVHAEMAARGIDTREYDQQIVRRVENRGFGDKHENRLHGNSDTAHEQVRSRLANGGVDPTSLNARFGRSAAAAQGAPEASRYGEGRIRRR